jgi:hypothetical protein
MYLYLHAPRPTTANPPNPRTSSIKATSGPWPTTVNDSRAARQLDYEPENNRVITIDL